MKTMTIPTDNRFVCVVGYDEGKGRWIIEDHEEPVQI